MMENQSLSAGKIISIIVLGIFVICGLFSILTYNTLVELDESVKTAQSDIEVQYQRRFDLIPNLVNSLQGIFNQEKQVFDNLAQARSKYAGTSAGSSQRIDAITGVESALSRLLVVVENYPQLKSSESVLKLQDQLEGTENRIQVARNGFNSAVNDYNQKVRRFPGNIIAGLFGFVTKERFEAKEEAQAQVPSVIFK